MQLILASQSPRRKELMGLFRLPFVIRAADIDETMDIKKPPFDEVARVSRLKAMAVDRSGDDVVIAADTIVVCMGTVLGKPKDAEEAVKMLSLLSGRDHQVMTGVTVLRGENCLTCTEVTDIHFRPLSEKEIFADVRTGEPSSEEEAFRMLSLLSGRDHQVMTGFTVLRGDRIITHTEVTDIHFRPLSKKEIDDYIATGEPMDKAGAYGIQGGAALFAEKMVGDYYNVMGLPVCRLGQMLRQIAPEIMEDTQ